MFVKCLAYTTAKILRVLGSLIIEEVYAVRLIDKFLCQMYKKTSNLIYKSGKFSCRNREYRVKTAKHHKF